ncbi:MAG: amino acid permease [Streptosporangiales bacterium]|nr:amino acid permease [Streptosporangiales bacterium]
MWGLTIALSTLSYGAAGFLLEALGAAEPSRSATTGTALVILAVGTVANVAAGSIAEEVERPEREVPKALILSLLAVGLVVMYSSAALILAVPNLSAVVAGGSADPVAGTLAAHFGPAIGRPMLVVFVIGFLASLLAVQAAVSRVIWASARDDALPGARVLRRLRGPERLPVASILLTAAGATVFVLLAGSDLYAVLVNFTTVGFYVAFGVPVWGASLAHLRGRWRTANAEPLGAQARAW